MNIDNNFIELLDRYFKGDLGVDEKKLLEEALEKDAQLKRFADEHLEVLLTLQKQQQQEALRGKLDEFHKAIDLRPVGIESTSKVRGIGKYWPTIAVAASVALISVVGTLLSTQSLKQQQNSQYKELTRKVDQIKKSQQTLIADIAAKEKPEITLAKYVGTGFLISSNGYLLTSAHVVRNADSVYVENRKFGRMKAEVILADAVNDVAILHIDTNRISLPYTISSKEADLGENVFTLGFPKEDVVYGEGTISSSSGYRQNESAYQIAVPVNPGNSGGPLLNGRGEVIGMISGVQTETYAAAFATKSGKVLELIDTIPDSLGSPIRLPSQNRLKGMPRVDQVKKLRDYVFVVKVYNEK